MTIRTFLLAILVGILLALAFLLDAHTAHAESTCNVFETIQSLILSEATRQPFAAQLEIARVFITKSDEARDPCFLSPDFYSGYAVALRYRDSSACLSNWHCKSFYFLYEIPADVRESAAVAAYIALTEEPRVKRYHFDAWDSRALWWDSPRACPTIYDWRYLYNDDGTLFILPLRWKIIAEVRFC